VWEKTHGPGRSLSACPLVIFPLILSLVRTHLKEHFRGASVGRHLTASLYIPCAPEDLRIAPGLMRPNRFFLRAAVTLSLSPIQLAVNAGSCVEFMYRRRSDRSGCSGVRDHMGRIRRR